MIAYRSTLSKSGELVRVQLEKASPIVCIAGPRIQISNPVVDLKDFEEVYTTSEGGK